DVCRARRRSRPGGQLAARPSRRHPDRASPGGDRAGSARRSPRPGAGRHHPPPRACGEHASLGSQSFGVTGSSPRLRGTRHMQPHRPAHPRFIPAPAGNTANTAGLPTVVTVHPRACGEHAAGRMTTATLDGSSPRLRGTLARHCPPRFCPGSSPRLRGTPTAGRPGPRVGRFIPAPAGNTHGQWRERPERSVHPRACGEHPLAWNENWVLPGSSPRLRGTRSARHVGVADVRFIPAPAGNTHGRVCVSYRATVHPRACGEHPGGQPRRPWRSAVHPRACGEHTSHIKPVCNSVGSSPRLRGTLFACLRLRIPRRFIPAPAGNT
ncbi:MAG: hypothetical protein JWP20_897, partial [Roseomonas sp.]|nr:hypothetical protein [Roseomonas sp.]